MRSSALYPAVLALTAVAIDIPANDPAALSSAAKQVSNGVLLLTNDSLQYGIGMHPGLYLWWEFGAAWDALINYQFLTGDASHEAATQAGLIGQWGGRPKLYMPSNQSLTLGNYEQAVWGLAAMSAAERGFPMPEDQIVSWEDVAAAVFFSQAARWDRETCGGGGIRWGVFDFQKTYHYKNAASQATFFQLAARLARFTGNQTYVDWATRVYEWAQAVALIDPDNCGAVYDGIDDKNCSFVYPQQYSHTVTAFAYGSAVLANMTSSPTWTNRTTAHLTHLLSTFFPSSSSSAVFSEPLCHTRGYDACHSFPALSLRWLALIPVYQPATLAAVFPALNASAVAAAARCITAISGGGGRGEERRLSCTGPWIGDDDDYGLGQQLAALEVLQSGFVVGAGGVNASVAGALRTVNGTAVDDAGGGSATTGGAAASASATGGASGLGGGSWAASLVAVAVVATAVLGGT